VKQTNLLDGVTYVAQKQYGTGGFLQSIIYPDGDNVGPMAYDAAGRLNFIPGIVTSVAYDAAGQPTVEANANGTTTTKTYTARGFLTTISTTGPSGTIQNLGYTPDSAGMLTQVTSPFTNESWSYSYDDLHRLTAATGSQNQTFQYDEIGRITYNSLVGTYAYGTSRPHAPSAVAGNAMTYDANGYLLTGQGRTITWNSRYLASQINQTAITYDAFGDRVKKQTGASTTIYPMANDDYEIANGTVTKYIAAVGLGVMAKKVGAPGAFTTYWLHTDRLGSIQVITSSSGAEIQRRTYRPYGDKIADTTGLVESRGYIGERHDSETGLTYLHARYYDPSLGTFISPDPIGAAGGLNEYGYSFGDPINNVDVTGLRGEGRDGGGETCDRFPWSCTSGQMGGGFGGMGGPGPGSSPSSSSPFGDDPPPILVGPNGEIHGGGYTYDPETGMSSHMSYSASYQALAVPYEALQGSQVACSLNATACQVAAGVAARDPGGTVLKLAGLTILAGLSAGAIEVGGVLGVSPSVLSLGLGESGALSAAALTQIIQNSNNSVRDAIPMLNQGGASQLQSLQAITQILDQSGRTVVAVVRMPNGAAVMVGRMAGAGQPIVHVAANGATRFGSATVSFSSRTGAASVTDIILK